MKDRYSSKLLSLLCLLSLATASQAALPETPLRNLPEEVVITGGRGLMDMRHQLLEAERKAYDVFNALNDEKRFHISCSMHQPTGTRLEQQVCQAAFELEASRVHGRIYLDSLCDVMCVNRGDGQSHTVHVPQEIVIASQMDAYRRKLREVAEQHPEFLDALIEYTQLRERYQEVTGSAQRQ
jgi:hypothetical protein